MCRWNKVQASKYVNKGMQDGFFYKLIHCAAQLSDRQE